jgi:hypothetical protein
MCCLIHVLDYYTFSDWAGTEFKAVRLHSFGNEINFTEFAAFDFDYSIFTKAG